MLLAVLCMASATSPAPMQPAAERTSGAARTSRQVVYLAPGPSARAGDLVLPNVTHSGYLPIDPEDGSRMFYAYYEAQRGAGANVPIILWLEVRCLPMTHAALHNCLATPRRPSRSSLSSHNVACHFTPCVPLSTER